MPENIANEYDTIQPRYCPTSQMCQVPSPPTTISHDAAGNLTADENDLSYQYDHENHLLAVRYVGGGANYLLASFVYDAQGRMHYAWRRADTDTDGDAEIKHFYYDGSNILAEYDNNNGLLRRYIHGTHGVDERAILLEGDGSLVSSNPNVYNVQPFYYLLQELDTVTGLLADNGTLVESYNYNAYGDPDRMVSFRVGDTDRDGDVDDMDTGWIQGQAALVAAAQEAGVDWPFYPRTDLNMDGTVDTLDVNIASANWTGNGANPLSLRVSGVGNPYFFTGRRLHFHEDRNATGLADNHHLQYNRARHYSPLHGRWLQRDPLGTHSGDQMGSQYADGMNPYEYVGSHPTNTSDPLGLWEWDMHYQGTFDSAVNAGMNNQCAKIIADWNWGVDQWTGAASFPYFHFNYDYNRLTGNRDRWGCGADCWYSKRWNEGVRRLRAATTSSGVRRGLWKIGESLHSFQDSFSHRWGGGHYAKTPFDHTVRVHCTLWGDPLGIILWPCINARKYVRNPNWHDAHRPDKKSVFPSEWERVKQRTESLVKGLMSIKSVKCHCKK